MNRLTSPRNPILACFSPLVMLLTFSFEFTAAAWIAWRYQLDRRAWLIIAVLINLAIFQVAEYQVCANHWAANWARVGFVATAILIPLGLYLIDSIVPSRRTKLAARLTSLLAIAFIVWFIAVPESVTIVFCGGNYTFFRIDLLLARLYSTFYYLSLLISVGLGLQAARQARSAKLSRALVWLVVGYLSFMLPTLIINGLNPILLSTLPSVLCGFAVIMAIILVGMVAPVVLKPRAK